MSNKKLCIPFSGSEVKDYVFDLTALSELLPEYGFRPLTEATPEQIPEGSVVLIYNKLNNSMLPIIVVNNFSIRGFYFVRFNEILSADPETGHMNRIYDFEGMLFKVVLKLPISRQGITEALLEAAIHEGGFKPLKSATSNDLHTGQLILLCKSNKWIHPVIVRVLQNDRLLFVEQDPVSNSKALRSQFIEGKYGEFEKYSYFSFS